MSECSIYGVVEPKVRTDSYIDLARDVVVQYYNNESAALYSPYFADDVAKNRHDFHPAVELDLAGIKRGRAVFEGE